MSFRNMVVAGVAILAGFGACSGNEKPEADLRNPEEVAAACAACDNHRSVTRYSVLKAVDKAGVMPVSSDMVQRHAATTEEIDYWFCKGRNGLGIDDCGDKVE